MVVADLDRDGLPDMVSPLGNGFVAVLRNPVVDVGLVRPALNLLRSAKMLELSWPGVFKSFSLKEADNLSSPVLWKASTNAVKLVNDQYRAVIESMKESRFFRLEKVQ